MPEDKKIRVSADTSPLQDIRRGAQSLFDDLIRMEGKFKSLTDETTASIQKHIDLLKERNSLIGGSNDLGFNYQPVNRQSNVIDPNTGRFTDGRTPGQLTRSIENNLANKQLTALEKIFAQVVRIADSLEQGERNEVNSAASLQDGGEDIPEVSTKGVGRGGGSKFSVPTSVSGVLGKAGIAGAIVMGIGLLAGRMANMYAQQYTAENRFQRENQRWGWLPFVGSAIEQVKEADRQAAQRYEGAGSQRARLRGSTYHNETAESIRNAGVDISFENDYTYDPEVGTSIGGSLAPGGQIITPRWKNNTTGEFVYQQPNTGDSAYQNAWYAKSLGMSMSQYTQRQNELMMAGGGRPGQTSDYRMDQLMLAEQIRGVSQGDTEGLMQSVRFGSDQKSAAGSAYAIIQTFDKTLQLMGKTNSEIVGTLGEYLGQFNRTSSQVLDKTGSINSAAITQTIASLRSRGFEGKQLERMTSSLSGGTISQDDTSQALLLRTARQLNPGGSLSDLMADIDEMQNGGDLSGKFFDQLKEMTGGGEMFRHVLKSAYPQLSYSDIRSLTSGKNAGLSGSQLMKNIQVSSQGYSRGRASEIQGTQTADSAAEATRKEAAGLEMIENAAGKPLSQKDTISSNLEQTGFPVLLKANQEQATSLFSIENMLRGLVKQPWNITIQGD